MKSCCCLYGNCQMDGILHFLRKTPLASEFDFKVWHNWRLVLLEEEFTPEFLQSVSESSVFIYQPTGEFLNVKGEMIPSTDFILANHVRPDAIKISLPYVWNSGFFPILKAAPSFEGWLTGREVKSLCRCDPATLLENYDFGDACLLNFDCALRFAECLAEQSRREQTCDIKMADFILANFQTQRLFLTQNHPSSVLFVELTKRIIWRLIMSGVEMRDGTWNIKCSPDISWTDINEANLPGALPVHPAVVSELRLKYAADADYSYYRKLLEEFIANPDK